MKTIIGKFLPLIIIVVLTSIACNLPVRGAGLPPRTVDVSSEAAQTAIETIENSAGQLLQGATVTINLSEVQLTSLLSAQLEKNADSSFSNPQVLLENGKILVYGKIDQGLISANAVFTLAVVKDSTGKPSIQLESLDLGQLPAPQNLLDSLTGFVNKTVNAALNESAKGFEILDLAVMDDTLSITVRKN
jgi:hypothetical protein